MDKQIQTIDIDLSSLQNDSPYTHLPGVCKVEIASIKDVEIKKVGNWGDYPVTLDGLFQKTNLLEHGKLEIKRKNEGLRNYFSYKLTFESTTDYLSSLSDKALFRVTMVSGEVYLIGVPYRPFPRIELSFKSSNSVTDKKIYSFSITWEVPYKPILVKV